MFRRLQGPAASWPLPLQLLQQTLVRRVAPGHRGIFPQPFAVRNHAPLRWKLRASEMMREGEIAFGTGPGFDILYVPEFWRALQQMGKNRIQLRDARIAVPGGDFRGRPG